MIARTLLLLTTILTISGCSIFGERQVEIVTKPVKIDIIQPTLPREMQLGVPNVYVVSEAIIANPCKKVVQEDGSEKRPKACDQDDRENPSWPAGYTYLDRFLDEMKTLNDGSVVFVAMTIKDYEVISANMQEIRRYVRELGEVIVYYRNVTINDEPAVAVEGEINK